jgi:hypothetical protein
MLSKLAAAAGAQVARHADFDRNLAFGELFDEFWILFGGQAVSDALGLDVERAPDRFGSGALAGVGGERL